MFPRSFTFSKDDIGDVLITAQISNLVSETSLDFQFTLYEIISGLTVTVTTNGQSVDLDESPVHAAKFTELSFEVSFLTGSHFHIEIDYGDGVTDKLTPSSILTSLSSFKHSYEDRNIYNVSIYAYNEVSKFEYKYNESVHIYDEVEEIEFKVENVVYEQDLYPDLQIFDDSSELFTLIFGVAASKT